MEILGVQLETILRKENKDFLVIDKHYEFIGEDHDLWEFKAIIYNIVEDKYFSVNWYDNYVGWWECGLDQETFELIQVFPKRVLTTVYENN